MWYGRLTGVRFDGIPRARAEHLRAPFFPVENERCSQLGPPPRRLSTPPKNSRTSLPQPSRMRMSNSIRFL